MSLGLSLVNTSHWRQRGKVGERLFGENADVERLVRIREAIADLPQEHCVAHVDSHSGPCIQPRPGMKFETCRIPFNNSCLNWPAVGLGRFSQRLNKRQRVQLNARLPSLLVIHDWRSISAETTGTPRYYHTVNGPYAARGNSDPNAEVCFPRGTKTLLIASWAGKPFTTVFRRAREESVRKINCANGCSATLTPCRRLLYSVPFRRSSPGANGRRRAETIRASSGGLRFVTTLHL